MKLLTLMLLLLAPGLACAAFTDNGDGTITDTVTCLQWQKATMDTNNDGTPDPLTWQQALAAAEGLTLAGKSDWRLPDKNELRSLVDYSRYSPAIDPVFAATTQPSSYWSSTTFADSSHLAWLVNFFNGLDDHDNKTPNYYVRAVRGTQCGPKWTPPPPTGRIFNSPMTGPPGTTFTQSGTGFRPNSTVTLHFRDLFGLELPVVQRATDATGAFSLTYTAPLNKPFGTYTWWAVDDATGGMSERIGYLIVNPGASTDISQGSRTVLPSITVRNSYGTLESEGAFDSEKETFVIVHGWNLPFFPTSTPEWMIKMGKEIKKKGANVLYWNWQEKARTKVADKVWNGKNDQSCYDISLPEAVVYPPNEITDPGQMTEIPYDETKDSGSYLAGALNGALKDLAYDQPIHFVGHSLGTLVSTYAIQRAHKNEHPWADLISHLVFLDSPCYGGVPGGDFLRKLRERRADQNNPFFWENYMSQVGKSYKGDEAVPDVNVWLQPKAIGLNTFNHFDAHAYAHEWYAYSVDNFTNKEFIKESSTPSTTRPYGFYWWQENNRVGVSSDYSQNTTWPHYQLSQGTAWDVGYDVASSIVIDLTDAYAEATVEMAEQIAAWAKVTGHVVKIVGISVYNTVTDVANYVVDTAGHAVLDSFYGSVTLTHASTAVLDMPVVVPAEANVLTFGLDFLYGESGSLLEVFVNGKPVQHINSDEALGEGLRMVPWINVEQFAGQTITLSLRVSNPNQGTQGKIRLDDLILAKVEEPPVLAGDIDNNGVVDLADVIMNLQVGSGGEVNNKIYPQADVDGDGKVGLPEAIRGLRRTTGAD